MVEFLLSSKASFITVRGLASLMQLCKNVADPSVVCREAPSMLTAAATPEPSSAIRG